MCIRDRVSMMHHFKNGGLLHHHSLLRVFAMAEQTWATMPRPVTILSAPKDRESITIVGDLHGQFPDLFQIFQQCGLPSERNKFVFNGDLVDRGQQGLENIISVVLLKCLYPCLLYTSPSPRDS
eukprot:TRINITY_DN21123_c0_g2_i1.p1 TRINITY_DN21123_c0_g2~~TRINITY_DN21123_c0_g2_i1.p1  ORF type:complete len:124 (+),score=30.97 TRINITY_DN21123_c0_g2_i1:110-481(+)